jgi:hypothetical protein
MVSILSHRKYFVEFSGTKWFERLLEIMSSKIRQMPYLASTQVV